MTDAFHSSGILSPEASVVQGGAGPIIFMRNESHAFYIAIFAPILD
jgi:hypothetical protein